MKGFDTLNVHAQGAVLFVEIAAPPMNLLGPELVRDLVSLIPRAEADSGQLLTNVHDKGSVGADHLGHSAGVKKERAARYEQTRGRIRRH